MTRSYLHIAAYALQLPTIHVCFARSICLLKRRTLIKRLLDTMTLRTRADTTLVQLPPKPLVLTPSGTFDGDDGKWSTFNINIAGDGEGKGQNFKVLISISSPITMVPRQTEWCSDEECAKRRGTLDPGALGLSTTLSDAYRLVGIYTLPLQDLFWWSQNLMSPNFNGTLTGAWAQGNVGLGGASKQSITFQNQYVVSSYLKEFYLGSLGLSIGSISPTGASLPTFFTTLAQAPNKIASPSYGFTAGASYRKYPCLPTLRIMLSSIKCEEVRRREGSNSPR